MALLRKDLRIGFLAGGFLLVLAIGYALVLTFSGSEAPTHVSLGDLDLPETVLGDGASKPADQTGSEAEPAAGIPLPGMLVNTRATASDDWSVFGVNGNPPHVTETPTRKATEPLPEAPLEDFTPTPNLNQPVPANPPAGSSPVMGGPGDADVPQEGLANVRTHVVEAGDSFSTIAKKYYGDINLYTIIQRANPGVDSRRLRPGQRLLIPDQSSIPAAPASPASDQPAGAADAPGTYTVAPGDTLSLIASRKLGRAALWEDIYKLNRDVIGPDPANLKVGMKLKLPAQ